MTAVDWSRYRKCTVCGAPIGEPCAKFYAVVVGVAEMLEEADAPHSGRELRTGYGR